MKFPVYRPLQLVNAKGVLWCIGGPDWSIQKSIGVNMRISFLLNITFRASSPRRKDSRNNVLRRYFFNGFINRRAIHIFSIHIGAGAKMIGSSKAVSVFFMLMLMTHDVYRSSAQQPIASGVSFIGIGYNLLKGNPEGEGGNGGPDPGLLTTRHVIDLTYDEGKLSSDTQYRVPDEVEYTPRSSSSVTTRRTTFHSTSSYARKLDLSVEVTGEVNTPLASARFGASTGYNSVKDSTESGKSVFFASATVKNRARVRLQTNLARADQYRLGRGFVAAACSLPNTWSESEYRTFINDWGTHVVTYVDVGILEGANRIEELSSFVTFASKNVAASVSAGGEYKGYSASLAVDMGKFNSAQVEESTSSVSFSSYTVGSEDLHEPIKITLKSMHEIFEDEFWTRSAEYITDNLCSNSWQRSVVQGLLLTALGNYSAWEGVSASTDAEVIIPLTWPIGVYGLPKPTSDCPGEFDWNEGSRSHDTEPNNEWSDPLHLAGVRDNSGMTIHFCMKTVEDTGSGWTWPEGSYCIYKYDDDCPANFEEGWIKWDDKDYNYNSKSGILPAGKYDEGTTIYFCCRTDGLTTDAIYLPTERNFMLFPRFEHCQQVHDMDVAEEWFIWDTENTVNDDAHSDDSHPYEGVIANSRIKLYFCYYSSTPSNPTSLNQAAALAKSTVFTQVVCMFLLLLNML